MHLKLTSVRGRILLALATLLVTTATAFAQSTAFSYQGRLTDQGAPASGTYDFKFRLVDATEAQQGPEVEKADVVVTNGVFTVQLDFGAVFDGGQRFLEMSVRPGSGTGADPYTTLTPRQEILSTPYAVTAANVGTSAGNSVVTAINASSATIDAARLPSTLATQSGNNTFSGTNTFSTSTTFSAGLSANNQRITNVATPTADGDAATKAYVDASAASNAGNFVQLAPAAQQTTSSTNDLINLKLNGAGTLGTSGTNDLLSLSASGTYSTGALNMEWFRVDNAGGVLAMGTYDGENEVVGTGTIPAEGNGSRMMWYGAKAAFRSGYVNNGAWDDANIGQGSFAAGMNNRASGRLSTAFGNSNVVSGIQSMAIGGNNTVSGANSFAHGSLNTVSGNNSTALGSQNTIGSSANSGAFTFGLLSQANASQAYAIGERATVGSTRAMVISLGPSFGVATNDAGTGTFSLRAVNGIWFGTNTGTPTITSGHFIDTSTGAYLTSTGVWTNTSDRNLKENFSVVNGEDILSRLRKIPMTTWNYRADKSSIRHLGPMAQDFSAAFGLGDSDKAISTVDASGVALAASQALEARTTAQQQRIDALEQQVKEQQAVIDGLRKLLCQQNAQADVCKIK